MHLGLTPTQFTILRWLNEAGGSGLNQKHLAEKMASDPNTIASLVCRMKEAGLVGCDVDPDDRRAKRVRILAKGRRLFEQATPHALELQDTVLKAIPAADRPKFLRQLEALADACQDEIDPGAAEL